MNKSIAFIASYVLTIAFFFAVYQLKVLDPLKSFDCRLDVATQIVGEGGIGYMRHYHNLNNVIKEANESDVLVYGNSRSLLGLRNFDVMLDDTYGKKAFFLSQGSAEKAEYLKLLIQKFEFKNKLFLINVDKSFFKPGALSAPAKEALSIDGYNVIRDVNSKNLKWQLSNVLMRLMGLEFTGRIIGRKIGTESWKYFFGEPDDQYDVVYEKKDVTVLKLQRKMAVELVRLLKENNNTVVFIAVPYSGVPFDYVKKFGRICGVKVIAKELIGLYTNDDSHLDESSANVYTEWLLGELEDKFIESEQ